MQAAVVSVPATPRDLRPVEKLADTEVRKPTVQKMAPQPKIFIGHGHSNVWRDLKDFLSERLKLDWDEFNREPAAGLSTKERLQTMLHNSRFAFLVMTAEEEHPRGTVRARENVIHEVGLFQGRLGFERAIILLEEGCAEFSNIHGLTQIRFPRGNIKAAFEEIRMVLEREGILADATARLSPKAVASSTPTAVPIRNAAQDLRVAAFASLATPNIVFLNTDTVRLRFEGYQGEGFYRSDSPNDPFGVIACFRNEPSSTRRVIDANDVRAQIIYKDGDGKEIGNGVPRACWVGHKLDLIDFPLGQANCAVLMMLFNDGKLLVPWKERARSYDWMGGGGDIVRTRDTEFSKDAVKTIEIRLIGHENESLLPPLTFDFAVIEGRPDATIKR
jgi:predicted nucleotide-binding protein